MLDLNTLVTTVKNISGQTMFFSFLPPHGQSLIANEEMSIFGNITEAVNRGDRSGAKYMHALRNALLGYTTWQGDVYAKTLEIVSTPSPILYDTKLNVSRAVYLHNNVLVMLHASWDATVSESVSELSAPVGYTAPVSPATIGVGSADNIVGPEY